MGRLFAVEIIYRGIFQKTLAKNISRGIVLAAHHEGKPGISFGRYGDSPERNGIPAKNFAIVGTDVESWAWYGLQPANALLKPNATLLVTSKEPAESLIEMTHRKEVPYKLAILKGIPSFSGLWVFKEDHTDVRILGAIAKL